MNAQKPAPIPQPVPMVKETILKDDRRFLSYYTFPEEDARPPLRREKDTEDTDV